MTTDMLRAFEGAIRRGDATAMGTAVAQLPAYSLPEARKRAEQIADMATASAIIRAIDDRADATGVK